MPCIYPFQIKKDHIFPQNDGPSILQKKLNKICNVFCTASVLITTCKNIAKKFEIFLQYGQALISEKEFLLFNFKPGQISQKMLRVI